MAEMNQREPRTGPSRRPGATIAVAGDRTSDFKRARRHSGLVRRLRWVLPSLCLTFAGIYAASLLNISELTSSLPGIEIPRILPENLTMDNPHYEGFGKDGSSYKFSAKTAQQNFKDLSEIKLDGIDGELIQADKKVTRMTGARGVYNHETSTLELVEAIDISSDSGLKAKLASATVETKEGLITSKEPVLVEFPGGLINSNSLRILQKAQEATFDGTVKARLTPLAKEGQSAGAGTGAAAGMLATSNAPIDISSKSLEIKEREKTATFAGDVVAIQGDTTLTTSALEVHYERSGKPEVPGTLDKAAVAAEAREAKAGGVNRIVIKGPVVMTRGLAERVTSDGAEFINKTGQAVLTGNVVMTSGSERRATSDRVSLDTRADSALLMGNVSIASGTNELHGRQMFVDRRAGRMLLTAPAGLPGPGRVTAKFSQAGAKPGKPQKAPVGGAGITSFQTDPNAPVEIEAEQLDANDAAKVAIFRGEVRVKQGAFLMRTPELRAMYAGGSGISDVAGTQGAAETGKPATQLTRLEAKRNVVVTSKDGQTVTGENALYDAKSNTVTMTGDVVLTQGQNVIRGTRLVIDMTSGESTIETALSGTSAGPAGGGWVTDAQDGSAAPASKGRPSAVFYPSDIKELRDGASTRKTKPRTGEGGASTAPNSSGQSAN